MVRIWGERGQRMIALAIATTDGAIAHMPLERKQTYFAVYGSYETFEPSASEERASWRSLQALNRAATLSDAEWRGRPVGEGPLRPFISA